MKKTLLYLFLPIILFLSGCKSNNDYEIYYPFKNQTWDRFNFLQFEIPIERTEGLYDVLLFVRHTQAFEFDNLDFHMIMKTPSGEERIREYSMNIRRKDGGFTGQCSKDSCEATIILKKELKLAKGTLSIQLENVVPRLHLGGLLGLGIRVSPAGK